jgi:DNA-binding Xre family transcriptional regulator
MGFSYKRLWKMLIDREMKRQELRRILGISGNTIAKMGREEMVSLEVLDKICNYLNCSIEEIIEHIPDQENNKK